MTRLSHDVAWKELHDAWASWAKVNGSAQLTVKTNPAAAPGYAVRRYERLLSADRVLRSVDPDYEEMDT